MFVEDALNIEAMDRVGLCHKANPCRYSSSRCSSKECTAKQNPSRYRGPHRPQHPDAKFCSRFDSSVQLWNFLFYYISKEIHDTKAR